MGDSNDTSVKLITLDNLETYHGLMDAKKEEHSVELTQAQYDALSPEEKMNGKTYYITDADPEYGSDYATADSVAPVENGSTSTAAYAVDDYIYRNGNLYKVIAAIAIGDSFVVNTNIQLTRISDEFGNGGDLIHTLAGIGKALTMTSNIIDTDIDLKRTPVEGDRILIYCSTKYTTPDGIKVYNGNTAITLEYGIVAPGSYLEGLCLLEVTQGFSGLSILNVYKVNLSYSAGTGISIANNIITNDLPQLGENIAYYERTTTIIDGDLGHVNYSVEHFLLNFKADASSPSSASNIYTIYLDRATSWYTGKLVRVDGNNFTDNISSGQTLLCEITSTGSGTSSDPMEVLVLAVLSDSNSTTTSVPLTKNRYTISTNNWSISPDSSGYYTYTVTLTTELNANYSPNIYVSGSGDDVYPSATDKTMFSLIKRANLSTGTTLVLYAETVPTSDFYMYVEGEMKDASSSSGSIDKTSYTVSSGNWSSSTDAEGYYSYSLTLSTALKTSYSPNITISGSSGTEYPTSTQTAMFDLLGRANLSTTTTLMLYAKTKPTDTFYINVQGEAA